MSAETQPATDTGMAVALQDVARQVRRAYDSLGRPPSAAEAADHGPYNRNTLERRHVDARWHEVLHAAGVPSPRDIVVADLRERYADRYAWDGDTIRVRATQVADSTALRTVRIGHTLKRIVEGEDPRGQPDALVIERDGIRTNRSSAWIVRGRESGESA